MKLHCMFLHKIQWFFSSLFSSLFLHCRTLSMLQWTMNSIDNSLILEKLVLIAKLIRLSIVQIMQVGIPGQQWVLQVSIIDDTPLHVPPQDSFLFFVLVLVLVPPSQDFEHAPLIQEFHSQFTKITFVSILTKNIRSWISKKILHTWAALRITNF